MMIKNIVCMELPYLFFTYVPNMEHLGGTEHVLEQILSQIEGVILPDMLAKGELHL